MKTKEWSIVFLFSFFLCNSVSAQTITGLGPFQLNKTIFRDVKKYGVERIDVDQSSASETYFNAGYFDENIYSQSSEVRYAELGEFTINSVTFEGIVLKFYKDTLIALSADINMVFFKAVTKNSKKINTQKQVKVDKYGTKSNCMSHCIKYVCTTKPYESLCAYGSYGCRYVVTDRQKENILVKLYNQEKQEKARIALLKATSIISGEHSIDTQNRYKDIAVVSLSYPIDLDVVANYIHVDTSILYNYNPRKIMPVVNDEGDTLYYRLLLPKNKIDTFFEVKDKMYKSLGTLK